MRWLLRLGGLLLVLVACVIGVGSTLPVAHSAQVMGDVPGSPEEVWAVLTDVDSFPAWRPDVSNVTRLARGTGPPAWTEEGSAGTLTLEVTEADPPRRMVTRIADEGLPFGGRWTYELTPSGTGTHLVITEDGEIYNPVFRCMARFVFGYQSTLETYLEQLRSRMGGATGSR
jgi:uncharacterized protein YndB with AHSA1/START domain